MALSLRLNPPTHSHKNRGDDVIALNQEVLPYQLSPESPLGACEKKTPGIACDGIPKQVLQPENTHISSLKMAGSVSGEHMQAAFAQGWTCSKVSSMRCFPENTGRIPCTFLFIFTLDSAVFGLTWHPKRRTFPFLPQNLTGIPIALATRAKETLRMEPILSQAIPATGSRISIGRSTFSGQPISAPYSVLWLTLPVEVLAPRQR